MKKAVFLVYFSLSLLFVVSAAHLIFTSTGSTSFNASSTGQNFFNFSVNVTDVAIGANVTQVEVSLPSNFTFSSGTAGTDLNASFSSSSNLVWANSTGLIMNASRGYFWFNSSVSWPGNYTLSIYVTNSTTLSNSNLSIVVNDTTSPGISLVSPGSTSGGNSTGSTIGINASANDYSTISTISIYLFNTTNQINSSTQYGSRSYYYQFLGLGNGIYKVNITANDTLGNSNNSLTYTFIQDSRGPNITLSLVERSQTTLNISISLSDDLMAIGDNCEASGTGTKTITGTGTKQYLFVEDIECEDENTYTITCYDLLDNSAVEAEDYTTTDCQSSGSSGSGGSSGGESSSSSSTDTLDESFWEDTVEMNSEEFSNVGNISLTLEDHERVKIKLNEEDYYVGVVSVDSNAARIHVTSTSQEKSIAVGSSEKFDVDEDDYYDILVSVESIQGTSVNIKLEYIHDSVNAFAVEANSTPSSFKLSKKTMIILFIVLAVIVLGVLVFVYFKYYRNRAPKNPTVVRKDRAR